MNHRVLICILTVLIVYTAFVEGQDFTIDTDFTGGNIIVQTQNNTSTLYYTLDSDTVLLQPDLRDTPGNWFYWNFRISGTGDRTIHFKFPGNHIGSFGPAYSTDDGKSWSWLQNTPDAPATNFQYTFESKEASIRFSSGIPYQESDFSHFLKAFENSPYLNQEVLALSKKGRVIEKIGIKNPDSEGKYKVLLTARHHACEAMASYVLEGIIESVLQDENSSMSWLRDNVEFLIVPFMDIDGVEDGDQGKNRRPWDPLSDYKGSSIYNSTGALRKQVPDWSGDNLKIALDLHCPGLRGKWAETIFFVGAENPSLATEQKTFLALLESANKGELKLDPNRSLIEFGTAWNKTSGKSERRGFREWASDSLNVPMAVTLECAYANNNDQMVTPENARLFGKDIAMAIYFYLKTNK